MKNEGFRGLVVWRRAKNLAVQIYRVCAEGWLQIQVGLRDQLQRSAVSIPSNIAEGSLAELSTQIEIAEEIGYLDSETAKALEVECAAIGKMLGPLIKARSN